MHNTALVEKNEFGTDETDLFGIVHGGGSDVDEHSTNRKGELR